MKKQKPLTAKERIELITEGAGRWLLVVVIAGWITALLTPLFVSAFTSIADNITIPLTNLIVEKMQEDFYRGFAAGTIMTLWLFLGLWFAGSRRRWYL